MFAVCVAQNIAQFVRSDILEAGWRRSADRAVLPLNSLQTGNFSGKIRIFRLYERLITAKMAALQGLLKKIPKDRNRETSKKSRELRIQNRDRVSAYLIKSN